MKVQNDQTAGHEYVNLGDLKFDGEVIVLKSSDEEGDGSDVLITGTNETEGAGSENGVFDPSCGAWFELDVDGGDFNSDTQVRVVEAVIKVS